MNRADIDTSGTTFDGSNDLVVTSLSMLLTKVAYPLTVVKNQSLGGSYEGVKKDYGTIKYKHTANITVTDYSNTNKKNIENLINGDVVLVLENVNKDNDAVFEIYGYGTGLKMSEITRLTNENDGIVNITLASEDGQEEAKMPYSVWSTDYATTKALLEGLE